MNLANNKFHVLSFRKLNKSVDLSFEKDLSILSNFQFINGVQEFGSQRDFFGTIELGEYLPDHHVFAETGSPIPNEVPVNEEYFEWMDILSAVTESNGSFVFVELGAGYGRWSARAYKAAINFGIPAEKILLVTVEADPKHSQWCKKHLEFNNIPQASHLHFQTAISNFIGETEFFVQMPNLSREESEKNWYGQAIAKSGWSGAVTEKVPVTTLSEILANVPNLTIDLIDSDLQGEDWLVFAHNPQLLQRVKKIHIGTDTELEEVRLRQFFSKLGWINIYDFKGRGLRKTYVGEIKFVDGVQTWLNPEFL